MVGGGGGGRKNLKHLQLFSISVPKEKCMNTITLKNTFPSLSRIIVVITVAENEFIFCNLFIKIKSKVLNNNNILLQ